MIILIVAVCMVAASWLISWAFDKLYKHFTGDQND